MFKGLKALGDLVASIFETLPVPPVDFDQTINAIGLEELNNKGYINLPDSEFPIDPDFYTKEKAIEHETGSYIRHKRRWDPVIGPIHPIFLPRRWKDVSREDYDLMLPSIKLASRLLEEPQVLTFVKGFLKSKLQPINDDAAVKAAQEPLYTFKNEPLGDWSLDSWWETTWADLWNLKDCLILQFSSRLPNGCIAATGPGDKRSTVKPYSNAKSANIFLSAQFMQVFRRELEASQYSKPWNPGSHDESALLRTQFSFAVTLVHEVMHALWITSTLSKLILGPSGKNEVLLHPREPFFCDGRMNELGACWEDHVFGGVMHMLGKPTGAIMPYGMASVPFPGLSNYYSGAVNRNNPRKWGLEWQTEYPLEMKYIRRMFTSELWDEVSRYGIKRLRRKKKLGYRRYVNDKFFEGLAPGEAAKRVSHSPNGSVASKDGEEDEKGVLRRP